MKPSRNQTCFLPFLLQPYTAGHGRWVASPAFPRSLVSARRRGSNYGVNHDGSGGLRGLAWAPNIGWVVFEDQGIPRFDIRDSPRAAAHDFSFFYCAMRHVLHNLPASSKQHLSSSPAMAGEVCLAQPAK